MQNLEVVISKTRHNELVKQLGKVIKHKAGENTSDRYVAVNTMDVVADLHAKGFQMVSLSGGYSKNITAKDGKHRVDMINPDIRVGAASDPTFARVLVTNGYNARTALRVIAGMFRGACENGLVFGQVGDVSNIRAKHVEGIIEALQQVEGYIKKLPQMGKLIKTYADTEILDDMRSELAREMAMVRQEVIWGSKFNPDDFKIDIDSMTEIWRKEDKKKDAWTTFNVLQEKVIRGGYEYKPNADSTMRLAKAIVNPYTEDKINQELFARFNKVLIGK